MPTATGECGGREQTTWHFVSVNKHYLWSCASLCENMESEDGLLKLVFSDDLKVLPQQLSEMSLTTTDASQYLKQLSSFGLKKLGNEIDRISEERASIINQTQELAFQEYPTFIETAQCTQEIFQNFQRVNQSTEKLTCGLTTLKEKCLQFSKTAQSLSAARRLTSLALSRHTQLLEILELPQLMDTCVRNGYWEEALDLAAYVARLERKLGYIPLIVKVAQEVQSCTRLMLSQLLAQLRMPAQLPHCLKVVGYLRRMGVFSEEEIRLKFLQARDSWFRSTLDEIPKEDAYQHVLKTVELSRVHLFDIATQYRAIFTDEDPLVLANQDPNTNESAIYYSWIIQKITDFLGALQFDLPKVAPSSLESVFGQCMYFGLSFGRIGSDFRSLLVPLFCQVVYDRFDHSANKSEAQFAETMANFSLTRTSGSFGSSASYSYIQTPQSSSADQVQPPYALMKFSPVAELCNGLIAAFNELRMCAPVQLVDPVSRKLERTLCHCSQIMADFHRQEKGAFTVDEELEFVKCLQLYRNEFLSYVQKIVQLMFSLALVSAQTGFPTGEILKQDICCLNKSFILTPVDHLLVKEQPLVLPEQLLALDSSSSLTSDQQVEETKTEAIDIMEPNPVRPLHNNGILDEEMLPTTDTVLVGTVSEDENGQREINPEPVFEPKVEITSGADLGPVDEHDLETKPEQEPNSEMLINLPGPAADLEPETDSKPELASEMAVGDDSTNNSSDAFPVSNQDSALNLEMAEFPVSTIPSKETDDESNQSTAVNNHHE